MNKRQYAKSFLYFLLSVGSALWVTQVLAEDRLIDKGTLHVRGEARLMVAPDQVSLTLGVTTESASAKTAISHNNKKMQSVLRALTVVGLSSDDYKTQRFRVQPIWSSRPNNASKQWKAEIIAYRVTNNLQVTTPQIDRVGDIIGKATDAGANQVNAIHFSLSNPRQYRQQAITEAMSNAKTDAETLAAASGDSIVRTLSLQLDNAAASKVRVEMSPMAKSTRLMAADQASFSPPIDSGDITVSASVSVTYEIESQY